MPRRVFTQRVSIYNYTIKFTKVKAFPQKTAKRFPEMPKFTLCRLFHRFFLFQRLKRDLRQNDRRKHQNAAQKLASVHALAEDQPAGKRRKHRFKLMIREATADGVSFCPKICSVYPTPLDIRPVKSSGPALFKMSASVNVSVNSAAAVQRMPQTRNCTHESATPFTIGEKWSMMRICTEKPSAHK